ncbi:hypothetical protein TNCV_4132171 [Trichonephila clavipes]|nr:hypothetical protein TNCV_4132171 [Trichonephila clavipes]
MSPYWPKQKCLLAYKSLYEAKKFEIQFRIQNLYSNRTVPRDRHCSATQGLLPSRPRNRESWSSDEDDTCAGTPPFITTTPNQKEDVSRQIKRASLPYTAGRVFSSTRLELMTYQPRVCYLDH